MTNKQKATAEQLEQKPKSKYRVRNWAKYNDSLKQRGNINFWCYCIIQT